MKLKKILTSVISVSLASALAMCSFACSAMPKNEYEYDIPQDYCRTYYEVFVRSFSDSDGDGNGDLRGLINNLDYLNDGNDETMNDLGINGIWLMPIYPTGTYHGYDVKDYKAINPDYGTMADFDELVRECDKRGIWLQLDLVLNHSSSTHPWFRAARDAAQQGRDPETDPDIQRYSIVKADVKPSNGCYYKVPGTQNYWYLSSFKTESMPDLNLKCEALREDIKDIVDFWLEHGVHSFRLDAVPWVFGSSATDYGADNQEFWTWFCDYCNEKGAEVFGKEGDGITRYCYNVGEVLTTGPTVTDYFETGMTCFNYNMGGFINVGFPNAVRGYSNSGVASVTRTLMNQQSAALAKQEGALLSNFLSNHDNDRSAGYFDCDPVKIKEAAALYLLAPGNPYIYYGEEIGAVGSGRDENKRLHFNWGDKSKGITRDPSANNYDGEQVLGTWKRQNGDPSSILTYYRYAIQLRNRFPEIGRGRIAGYYVNEAGALAAMDDERTAIAYVNINERNKTVAAYTLTWNGRTVLIVHNIGEEACELDISAFDGYEIQGRLSANGGTVGLEGSTLNMGAGTVAVLKKA